jgi:hypothetical protein
MWKQPIRPRMEAQRHTFQCCLCLHLYRHWAWDCSESIRIPRERQMHRQVILAFLTWFLSLPFLAAQGKPAKLPSSPQDAEAFCTLVGEVRGRDVFAQTFLLRQEDGKRRRYRFHGGPGSSRSRRIRGAKHRGRLSRLDPSEATARLILVLERVRAPVKMAAAGPG